MADADIPEGYSYTPSASSFINHVGRVYQRRWIDDQDREIVSSAMRIEDQHVNSWGFAHAGVMATMADVGTAGPAYEENGPPVVVIELSTQFIAAPKLGDLLEVHGWAVKKTRSMAFTACRGEVAGK